MTKERIDILLVDDREDGLITLDAVLGDQGYNLVKAMSGREALGLLPLYDFAVILLDVQMPGLDGFETAALIREQPKSRHTPIIFVTAINKDESYVLRGYEIGAVDYLFKPFDPNVLKAKVSVFVDLHRKNQQILEQADLISQIAERERLHERTRFELDNLRRYQTLADAVPHAIWKTNIDGGLTYCNKIWCDYTGISMKEAMGTKWQDLFHQDDLKQFLKVWLDAMQTGESFSTECRFRRDDGAFRWHWIKAVPERDTFGDVSAWIGTCSDIHDRKITEHRLHETRMLAESANKAKTDFLANMSHEIRTPLNAILGFSELLLSQDMSLAEKNESIFTIRRNGHQLLRIIDEVLDISKIEAGRLEINLCSVDLRDLLNEVLISLSLRAAEKRIGFSILPDGKIPRVISTDPTRLRQILINIMGNAIKFTDEGSVECVVSWRETEDPENPKLHIEVTDSGVGIEEQNALKLFRPFVQGDTSTTRRFGGTGLGLALSRKLARALGGDVWLAKSSPLLGSTFIAEIGAVPSAGTQMISSFEEPSESRVSDLALPNLTGLRILLAEDAIDNQVLISRFLEMAGAVVDIAANGEEAVQKAISSSHDVVLMDIQMPEMDGYTATLQLRGMGYKGPIIALTAHALKEERERCIQAGCDDHLTKPINRRSLLESVSIYSQQSRDSVVLQAPL